MTIQQTILDQMAPAFFAVQKQSVIVGNLPAEDYTAVVRPDTNEVLAIHGKGYNLIDNESIMTQFVGALSESGLSLEGARVSTELSHGGARMFTKVILPEHKVVIRGGDEVDLMINVVNSYDGWSAFRSIFGGFRILCSNGLVIGNKMWQGYGRHTQSLDINAAAQQLKSVAGQYQYTSEIWKDWTNAAITAAQVETIVKAVTPAEKVQEQLLTQYAVETHDLGNTVWAAYNALTHWSTHQTSNRKDSSNTAAAARFQREEQVRKVLPQLVRIAEAA